MRILIRALPIFLLMGLCTVSLAQSNNSSGSGSGSQGQQEPYEIQATPQQTGQQGVSISSSGQFTAEDTRLTEDEVNRISETISLLQNQLQQIGDPSDPRAIKLQATIDKYQEILNNQ